MASFNKVILMGNLIHDPELRYTPNGLGVATFRIAMNRYYTTQAGEKKEEATFIRITVWGRQGENCHQYLSKGRGVLVEGRLSQRTWETPEGDKRSTIEVVAQNVQFLPRTASSAEESFHEPKDISNEESFVFPSNDDSF